MSQPKSTFQFNRFFVTESHFTFNDEGPYNISIGINPSGIVYKELDQFELSLEVLVKDKEDKFVCQIKTISLFDFESKKGDKAEEIGKMISSLFITNAPAIAFPYIRAYIANITIQSGLVNILLPTLNLTGLSKELKEKIVIK